MFHMAAFKHHIEFDKVNCSTKIPDSPDMPKKQIGANYALSKYRGFLRCGFVIGTNLFRDKILLPISFDTLAFGSGATMHVSGYDGLYNL